MNSTSVLLNKFPSSQEVNDLLVLEEFPLLLCAIFVLLDPDPDPHNSEFNLSLVEQASGVAGIR